MPLEGAVPRVILMLVDVGYVFKSNSNTWLEGMVYGVPPQVPSGPKSQPAWVLMEKETSWPHLVVESW